MRLTEPMTGWISLTFDDALAEHLDHAAPALDVEGLKGTFYTHLAAPCFFSRLDDWRRLASDGHELGNHTVFHPADSRKGWVTSGNAIDHYSLDRMRQELQFANDALGAIDRRSYRSYAYPCSSTHIGRRGWVRRLIDVSGLGRTRVAAWVDRWHLDFGSSLTSYEPLVGSLFVAGRAGGLEQGDRIPPVEQWQRTRLLSVAVDGWFLDDLKRHVTEAIDRETWAILQFHGVGGGHRLDCSLAVFHKFVSWLGSKHRDRMVTVIDGATRLWPDATPTKIPATPAEPFSIHDSVSLLRQEVQS